jgi:hypothetical protein
VTSYTTTATEESRMYDGIRLRNRSCPAVSLTQQRAARQAPQVPLAQIRARCAALRCAALQFCPTLGSANAGALPQRLPHQSCSRTVRSSRSIVLLRKSMPIVACARVRIQQRAEAHPGVKSARAHASNRAARACGRVARLVGVVELIVHEARDDGRLANALRRKRGSE